MSQKSKGQRVEDADSQEQGKWMKREGLQEFAKLGTDFLRKTVSTGIEAIKDAKENIPKEATQALFKGKDELLKGVTQDLAKNLVSFGLERWFDMLRKHKLEFSIKLSKVADKTEEASELSVKEEGKPHKKGK